MDFIDCRAWIPAACETVWDVVEATILRTEETGQDSWIGGFDRISWIWEPGSPWPVTQFGTWLRWLSCRTKEAGQDSGIDGF